ncbi:MAG: hypothetical protein AAF138_10965 [Planctomycetota bacterium]
MSRKHVWAGLGSIALLSGAVAAHPHDGPELDDRFAAMAPLVGYEWTIDAKWADGTEIKARNQYRMGLNGQFVVADTFAADAGGPEYHRYHTIYTIDPRSRELIAHGFTFDGTAAVVEFELTESDDGDTVLQATTENPGGLLRQSIEIEGDRYVWNVWMQPAGMDEWMPMMTDGVWKRGEALDHGHDHDHDHGHH